MLKGSSANRLTKIKVYEAGKCVKTITNASINYGQDFEQLRKMVEIAIRLSPQDPIYNVEKIFVANDGKDLELDQGELEQFQNVLFRPENQLPGQKVALTIHVGGKKGKVYNRNIDSENQENSGDCNTIRDSANGQNVGSALRAGSPLTKRPITPNKIRSVSRSRCSIAVPNAGAGPSAGLPRGMSPARNGARHLSINSRPISELMGAPVGSLCEKLKIPVEEKSKPEEKPMVTPTSIETSTSTSTTEAKIVEEPKPESTATEGTEIKQEEHVDFLAMHEAIVQQMEQKSRESIEETWTEVGGESNSPMPVKNVAPFTYYSPPPPPSVTVVKSVAAPVTELSVPEDVPVSAEPIAAAVGETESQPISEVNPLLLVEESSAPPMTPMTPIRVRSSDSQMSAPKSPSADDASVFSGSVQSNSRSKTPIRSAKKSMLISSSVKTPSKSANTATAVGGPPTTGSKAPVFPDGRTLRESSICYENSLRSYSGQTSSTSAKKKPQAAKSVRVNEGELSPVFQRAKSSHRDQEGRPSIGTITTQWEFMRTNFVNNSDEELEWLMVSKKQGAYNYANKKNDQAEDRYFRSLYEVDFYETKIKYFAGASAKIPAIIAELNAMYNVFLATPKDEAAIQTVATQHAKLVDAMSMHEKDQIFAAFDPKIEQNILAMLQETDRFKIVRKARDIYSNLTPEISALQGKLIKARKDGDEALKNMEKWSKRTMEADEYPAAMRAQEQAWMEKEYEDNMTAYRTMRSYFPANITDISPTEIANQYVAHGGLISLELAQELKSNKFLQWLETHPDDIVYESFLTGERKAFFENLESMDITELRALATVLPPKFELDNDGKKAEWRTRFFNRLKQLVSQQRREKVKGAWDPVNKTRAMVDLPPLKPDVIRRPVYFFRTKEQSDLKLKQFDDKLALLAKKKKWLETAEKDAKDAKEEYDTVLKEMRDPDFIEMYGAEQLASVKDVAKNDWANAEKKRKTLTQEVERLQKSIDSSPFTREQFLDKENELERFLLEKGILWAEKSVAPALIEGVFDADKPLEKRIKASAKFVSAEEEAAKRKMELESLKSRSMMASAAEIPEDELALADPMQTPVIAEDPSVNASSNAVAPATSVIELPSGVASAGSAPSTSENADPLASVSATPMTPTRTPRKHSILTHTNPELLNTLNKMFASPNPHAPQTSGGIASGLRSRTPNRRASVAIGATATSTLKDTKESDGPKEIKKSKSKLLKKMLGSQEEEDQSVNKIGLAATLPPGGFGGPGGRPMSALAMALGGAKPPGAPGGGMSFLDQIKARRAKESGDTSEPAAAAESAVPAPPTASAEEIAEPAPMPFRRPPNPFAAAMGTAGGGASGSGMSFLEQIKARRKSDD